MKKEDFLMKNVMPAPATMPIVSGKGITMIDANGKCYLDFASQSLNLLLGQCHSVIVDAITEHVKKLTFSSSRFGSESFFKASKKLSEMAPGELTHVHMKLSDGSDANETAVKIARGYTGKKGIIVFNGTHTGQTTQMVNMRSNFTNHGIVSGSDEDVIFINTLDITTGEKIDSALYRLRKSIDKHGDVAAVFLDLAMVNSGLYNSHDSKEYYQQIEKICTEKNIVFIVDENQTYGWVDDIFASNYYGLSPDIITLGKGLANGHPLAAVITKAKYKDVLGYVEAAFTHGGHPLMCAISYEVMNILNSKKYEVKEKSDYMFGLLQNLNNQVKTKLIVRKLGLIQCIEIEKSLTQCGDEIASMIFNELLERGVFIRKYDNYLILKPSIIVEFHQIEYVISQIIDVIKMIEEK